MAWGMEHGAWGIRQEADKWGMEPAACEDPPDGGDESREAGEHGQRVQGTEHGAWEGRALRNDPVGHFSEGASLQGRQVARSKWQGAWSTEHGAQCTGQGEYRS
jgi:hypothetical protein